MVIKFDCVTKSESWEGKITKVLEHNHHYFEINIQSRSSIMIIFGKTSRGGFACFPDYGVGCHIIDLKDKFWNTEKIVDVLGKVDGITVAEALYSLAEKINF